MKSTSFQPELQMVLPTVENNRDYKNHKSLLERIDEILLGSGIESHFISYFCDLKGQQKQDSHNKPLTQNQINTYSRQASQALRCSIARMLYQQSYVQFSCRLAESFLLQWFCRIYSVDAIRVPSKSQLQRYEHLVPACVIKQLSNLAEAAAKNQELNPLELEQTFDEFDILVDATCIESNIHFPVDWVLLRDGCRTLLKSIKLIRRKGLIHRIENPDKLLAQLNQRAIAIGRCKGRDSKRKRKALFRKLKSFAKRILKHGQRYRTLLDQGRNETSMSDAEVDQILKRIDNVLETLPEAIKQAHARIIRGEMTKNEDKILSLYDDSTNVIKRGKAGKTVEFGCNLMLAEQANGFIVDWQLYDADVKDVELTCDSVTRMLDRGLQIKSLTGDRGCDGPKSRKLLKENDIENRICSRSVPKLREQMKNSYFKVSQKRRAQTEARIGIAKNNFIGNPILNKDFIAKQKHIGWAILSHNLWVLARLPVKAVIGQTIDQAA